MERPSGEVPAARRGWDPVATVLLAGAAVAALWTAAATSGWVPLEPMRIRTAYLAFGIAALVLAVFVEAAARAWRAGSTGRAWVWGGSGAALFAAALALARAFGDRLPDALELPVPRLVWAAGALLLLVIGLSRRTPVEAEIDERLDWFARTERILERRRLWSPERARAQMRRARDEFNHAQARRAQGSAPLTPLEHFGPSEDYALALPDKPGAGAPSKTSGRWSYLLTAILLGGWAAYRLRAGMSWFTVALLVFAVVALALFIWASIVVARRR